MQLETEIKYFKDIPTLLRSIRTVTPRMTDFHIHRHEDTPASHLKETSIFRSDVYAILYLEEGEAYYKIGLSDYHMKPGSFYFHSAYHLRYYQKLAKWKGYVVLFTESFMNRKVFVDIPKQFPFYKIDAEVLLYPKKSEINRIKYLLEELHYFYHSTEFNKEEILYHYLNLLLTYSKSIHTTFMNTKSINPLSKLTRLAKSFEMLLEEHFYQVANNQTDSIFAVSDFADQLSVTPNHLSDVVKSHFGKTPTQLIRERLILEAQALLKSTDMSISQVAYFLHFKDPSNFAKFFKSYTQKSPSQYKLER